MLNSCILSCRAIYACQLQAWFSLRPYTREQRLIKAIRKQEERLKRSNLRRHDTPIVFQSQIDSKPLAPHAIPSSDCELKSSDPAGSSKDQLLDQSALNHVYNLSKKDSPIVLNTCCAGCGAKLHCGIPGSQGFLPEPEIVKLKSNYQSQFNRNRVSPLPVVCIRCQLIAQHKTALQQSIPLELYEKQVISELNSQDKSTILLVTDMTNLPHSVVPLRLNNPSAHRIVLIGNKVDQLPIDGPRFYPRWCEVLLNAFAAKSGLSQDSVSYVSLVSARTGYGVEKLLDFLLSKKFNVFEAPVYIVGSTNTGKSSLFNRLLLSDFCKSDARESIHRATVSIWPGTTVGLLKFPLARMNYTKRGLREQARYIKEHSSKTNAEDKNKELYGYMVVRDGGADFSLTSSNVDVKVEKVRNTLQDLSTKPTYRYRRDSSGVSVIEESEMNLRQLFRQEFHVEPTLERDQDTGDRLLVSGTIDPRQFNHLAWCYDTPGLESPDQSLNFLSSNQLVEYTTLTNGKRRDFHRPESRFLLPRTFVLRPGLTMLLGRLGRLDVLTSKVPVYLTTQTRLPVHIVETSEVDTYWIEYANFLGPGGRFTEDLASDNPSMPSMTPVDLESIQPVDLEQSVADVILSGAGWVSVSGEKNAATASEGEDEDCGILLRAWTPGGVGVSVRRPPLLPYAIRRRGKRLLYLREFSGLPSDAQYSQFSPR